MTGDAGLRSGTLARLGLLSPDALDQAQAVLDQVAAEGIESIRVLFADPHGITRGKTVLAGALPSVFRSGVNVPSTLLLKDMSGRTVFPIWDETGGFPGFEGAGDVLLVPDPATFQVLPWADKSAWIFCTLAHRDGRPLPFSPRQALIHARDQLATRGWQMNVGLEVEFHLYALTDPTYANADGGMPATPPDVRLIAPGYQFLSETVYDRMEPALTHLRRAATALDLPLRSVEVEMGPGQAEFVFDPRDVLTQADNMIRFRTMTREVAARHGLHASFMCRPRLDGAASIGWHLHQSLVDAESGQNLFVPDTDAAPNPLASRWIAGLLAHAAESCVLTTPTVNGYKRYQPYQMAPDRIQWGRDNRGAMIRALMTPGDAASRIENRVAEPAANPYYVLAAQILSGLSGVDADQDAPPPVTRPYDAAAPALPRSLGAALDAFEGGSLYRDTLGPDFIRLISGLKRAEWGRYLADLSDWEHREYFGVI